MKDEELKRFSLTVILIKHEVDSIEDCLRIGKQDFLDVYDLKSHFGLEGKIFVSKSHATTPKWKFFVDDISSKSIELADNTSNKAVLITKISGEYLAIVFGYGRSLLREELVVRNFGLKAALNIVNPNKMKSINAASIEDVIVNTQRQTNTSTSQDEFGINIVNDIMRGVTGEPNDPKFGVSISGKDALKVTVDMNLVDLKTKLTTYLKAYQSDDYKRKGFEWIDNVCEIKDSSLCETLDGKLTIDIQNRNIDSICVSPPDTIAWEDIQGLFLTGTRRKSDNPNNYSFNIDFEEYVDSISNGVDIIAKLKRDKLQAMSLDENQFSISSIYNSLTYEVSDKGKRYILTNGNWYVVNDRFYDEVIEYVKTRIPVSNVPLIEYPKNLAEGEYNALVCLNNQDYQLMDKKLTSVEAGPRHIEAADILTRTNQFIHVKNRGQSAQLSHLFAQGRISAICFSNDQAFRQQVYEQAKAKLGDSFMSPDKKPRYNDFEVIYAIADVNTNPIYSSLPFFSLLNLMSTSKELNHMNIKHSIQKIKKC